MTIEGRWHIHGESERAHYGTLSHHLSRNLELEVKIAEAKTDRQWFEEMRTGQLDDSPGIIQGFDQHNRPVRLFDCLKNGEQSSLGLTTRQYTVQRAVRGAEEGDWLSLEGRRFTMGFSILDCWINPSRSPKPDYPYVAPTKYVLPDLFTFYLDRTLTIGGDNARSEVWWLALEFDSPASVAKVDALYRKYFGLLLVLLTGTRVINDHLSFWSQREPSHLDPEYEVVEHKWDDQSVVRQKLPSYMRTVHHDVDALLPDVVRNWFVALQNPDMKRVLDLYGAVWYYRLFPGAHFLLIAQALEAYHTASRRFDSMKWDKSEFKAMMQRVRNALGKDDFKRLSASLAGANNRTFHQKLLDIVADAPAHIKELIPAPESFATAVKDNRNAHTHHVGERSHSKRVPDFELMALSDQALSLLEMLLLRDVGAPDKAFKQVVRECKSRRRVKLTNWGPD